jgi:uncharacterized membrane protein YidH (DUF202 family)
MKKGLALAIMVSGFALTIFGIHSTESFITDVSRLYHSAPTNNAVIIVVIGFLGVAVGLLGMLRRTRNFEAQPLTEEHYRIHHSYAK